MTKALKQKPAIRPASYLHQQAGVGNEEMWRVPAVWPDLQLAFTPPPPHLLGPPRGALQLLTPSGVQRTGSFESWAVSHSEILLTGTWNQVEKCASGKSTMATNHGCFSLKLQVADMLLQSHLMQNPEVWVESPVIKCGGLPSGSHVQTLAFSFHPPH